MNRNAPLSSISILDILCPLNGVEEAEAVVEDVHQGFLGGSLGFRLMSDSSAFDRIASSVRPSRRAISGVLTPVLAMLLILLKSALVYRFLWFRGFLAIRLDLPSETSYLIVHPALPNQWQQYCGGTGPHCHNPRRWYSLQSLNGGIMSDRRYDAGDCLNKLEGVRNFVMILGVRERMNGGACSGMSCATSAAPLRFRKLAIHGNKSQPNMASTVDIEPKF